LSQQSDMDAAVRAKFQVRDSFVLPEGEAEYKVTYDETSKERFVGLVAELSTLGFTPALVGSREDPAIIVRKKQPPKQPASLVPTILLFFTLLSVVFLCLLEAESYAQYAPGVPALEVVVTFGGAILAILAAHEYGHRRAAESSKTAPPTSYFIPGVPVLTYFLPNIGVVSAQREPAVNRDKLFDTYAYGPIAALIVTVVLYLVGEFAWVQSSIPLSATTSAQVNESAIQLLIDSIVGPFVKGITPGYFRLSPLADAAFVGFLLTFLNLLPITQFDGGYALVSAYGDRAIRVSTYLSVAALILIDTYNYWIIAIVILLIAPRKTNPLCLDEISDASPSKRAVFFVLLALAFLCLPVPKNIATFPL